MTFLNSGFAPWLLAIGLPIVIHLLTRRAIRVYSLPTFRFLERSVARQSKLFRIRHLLLLLLRAAVVSLLVMVFLKPSCVAPLAAPSRGGRRAAVVVDTSLSMGYRASGVSTMQRAQALGDSLLATLGPQDRVLVVAAGASPVLIQPPGDSASARGIVKRLVASEERCDAQAAISLAVEQLGKLGGGARELYLISDFQRTNWADVKLEAIPGDVKVVFVGVDEPDRQNAGVGSIRLRPANPRAGDDVTALVEVWNGSASPKTVAVSLKAGAGPAQSTTVVTPPFSSGTASFPVTFPSPGRYECEARVGEDGLAADNRRWLAADLQHSLTVLLLTDENAAASPNGSFFVTRALNPMPSVPGGIKVVSKRAADLVPSDLAGTDVVVICNVVTMPADKLPAILRYVQGGGSLVAFLYGERVVPQMEALNRLAGKGDGLPFLPTRPMDVRSHGKGYVSLAEARYESRLLRVFKDPSAADLGRIKFHRFFLTTEVDGRAETLLKFEDGTPAAARRALGSGSVLLLNFSPSPKDGDLVKQEVFPPLLHEMLKGMAAREGDRRDFHPGGAASTTIEPTRDPVTVVGPAGETLPAVVDRTGGGVVIERALRAGLYTVLAKGDRQVALMAVNIDPAESDLRSIDPRELQARQDRRPVYLAGSGPGSSNLDDLTRDRPLWPWLLLGLLVLAVVEHAVASMKPGRPRKTDSPILP